MPKAVVLTALDVEFLAIRAHLTDVREDTHPAGTVYECGRFETPDRVWDVAIVQVGMGNQRAAVETVRALAYFKPDIALFVGVAGGLKDVRLGDVVAASKVYAYEYGKADENFLPRAEVGLASYPLEQRAMQVARGSEWLRRVIPTDDAIEAKAIVKPVAAGAQVLASNRSPIFRFLRQHYSDAAAVEMEGHGFLEAVRSAGRVDALVVRGISDLVEGKNQADSDGWQARASARAAAFAFEVMARFHNESDAATQTSSRDIEIKPPGNAGNHLITPLAQSSRIRGVLPSRVRSFSGRKQELDHIQAVLTQGSMGEPTLLAIHGLSGVGKTQLCREYMELHRAKYELTYWISASDDIHAISDLAQLATDLQLTGANRDDPIRSSRLALQWLEQNGNWLLVFDNCSPNNVGPFLPSTGSGHIIISSNDPNWSSFTAHELCLSGLEPRDGVDFLVARTGVDDPSGASRIGEAFNYLPLALEQAAAYIKMSGIAFDDYETLLSQHRPVLLDERSPFTEYPESVYSALRLSVERVAERSSNSTVILVFMAFMNPLPVPRALVHDVTHSYFYQAGKSFDTFIFNRMIAELSRTSLLLADGDLLSTHPLVQSFVRDTLPSEDFRGWSQFALEALAYAFPTEVDDSSTWPQCEALIDHVTTAIDLAGYQIGDDESVAALYNNAGSYLHSRGRDEQAHRILSRSLEHSISQFDEAHPMVAVASNNLLNLLVGLDAANEALELGERAIRIYSKNQHTKERYAIELGIAYSNVGRIFLHLVRDTKSARAYFWRALLIHSKHLGPLHYTTAIDINNIGTVDRGEGKWLYAYAAFQSSVDIHRAVLSPSDSRLAIALFNLGEAAFMLDLYEEAESCLREAVAINDSLHNGTKGWDQMDALVRLGQTLVATGKARESIVFLDRAIDIGKGLLPEDSSRWTSLISIRQDAAKSC